MQAEFFANQKVIEEEALGIWEEDRMRAKEYLTKYCSELQAKVVQKAWDLAEDLWTKYDEKF
jgi:hypothetical protein